MIPGFRLEQFTLRHPQLVLLVQAVVDGEADEVLIFRGFSSSLMHPTAADPEVPVLPKNADIRVIDIMVGPYNPAAPQYLHRGLAWADMVPLLESAGV
ncbi:MULTISPECIES: hypothetical protein [Cyanophyceae]|uniref:DUF7734 family protein n=1 Tax=Cyanophyceae TaxID=3028117 RepID=UPI0016882190|nr:MULTISPECIES: hypothetical protein [Cyanophyceae]MBD1916990.1 hypothetical protein [Phormidium sp. FACHB-77]MBD2029841.1 hypothetical protein [Phormidium sp. FACHB-322]MBD2050371.1 hypothetical protein [Leptolyngbya sp. FACHB-60]